MQKVLLIDWDDTSVNRIEWTINNLQLTADKLAQKYGIKPIRDLPTSPTDPVLRRNHQTRLQQIFGEQHYPLAKEINDAIQKAHWPSYLKPYPGLTELITDAKKRGVKVAIVSMSSEQDIRTQLHNMEDEDDLTPFGKVADVVILGESKKPAAAAGFEALELLGLKREQAMSVVVYGDTTYDIRFGANLKKEINAESTVRTVLYNVRGITDAERQEAPDYWPSTPDHIVTNHGQTLSLLSDELLFAETTPASSADHSAAELTV